MAALKRGTPLAFILAAMQAAQIGSGIAGQLVLLTRWTPHPETDAYLILAGGAALISALTMVGGFEMALPAVIHRREPEHAASFLRDVIGIAWVVGILGALVGIACLLFWDTGLIPERRLWMAFALGGQALPLTVASLGRGMLMAEGRLVQVRLTVLVPSLITTSGYALLGGAPAVTLPLVLAVSTCSGAVLALYFCRDKAIWAPRLRHIRQSELREMVPLLRALVALALAGGIVQIQALVERLAVLSLGVGYVAGLNAAGRGWEALTSVIVAACVMPAYPIWARRGAETPGLLRQSLRRTWLFTLLAALGVGAVCTALFPFLAGRSNGLALGGLLALVLLPRSALLTGVQPLSLRLHAEGRSWQPLIGSVLSCVALLIGLVTLLPRFGLTGFGAATTLSTLVGCLYLGWRTCVS
jgi:O-antigen/teichoic acid export membrane protein